MQTKKNNQQHIIIRARFTGQLIVYLAICTFQSIQNYLYKLSGKRFVREIIDELGHAVVRETSVRESDCPGNVRYPVYTALYVHIFPALISLHWLRVPERIFKLAVLTYRAIHGTGPSYFQSCFTRVADMSRGRLRSSGSDRLHVPIIRRSTVGSRTFTVSGAAVWNDLPAHVTAAPSLAVFRQRLKTFPFSRSYPDIVT